MRAILHEDRIIALVSDEKAGVEIGSLPPLVGLERLRWDGKDIVDLGKLTEMYVKELNGVYSLHVIDIKGSQLVNMTYKDRKNLKTDSTTRTIRLKTEEEKIVEAKALDIERAKTAIKKAVDFADLVSMVDHLVQIVVNEKQDNMSALSMEYSTKTKLQPLLTSLREIAAKEVK
jgi:hypothetical protein